MKTSLVIPIALFAVFIVSEISCEKNCSELNDGCVENSDCCSNNCYLSINLNKRFCMNPKSAKHGVKVETGWCSYNASFHNETRGQTFQMLGMNAAHSVLPVGTDISLTTGDKNQSIDIKINAYLKSDNQTLLQLSKELADVLGVEDGKKIACSISLNHPKSSYSSLTKVAGISASFLVVVYILMSFL